MGPVQTLWSRKLWLCRGGRVDRDLPGHLCCPLHSGQLSPDLVSGPELSGDQGVRSCFCELLLPGLPSSHQTVLETFDLALNRAVPWAIYCAASSFLENALQVTAQQTEEMKCSQRRKTQKV